MRQLTIDLVPEFYDRINLLSQSYEGFDIDKMAEDTTINPSNLRKIFSGETADPALWKVKYIAEYFGVSVAYLLGETDIPQIVDDDKKTEFEKYGIPSEIVVGLSRLKKGCENNNKIGTFQAYVKMLKYLINVPEGNCILFDLWCYLCSTETPELIAYDINQMYDLADSIEQETPDRTEIKEILNNLIGNPKLNVPNDYYSSYYLGRLIDDIKGFKQRAKSIQDINDKMFENPEPREMVLEMLNEEI